MTSITDPDDGPDVTDGEASNETGTNFEHSVEQCRGHNQYLLSPPPDVKAISALVYLCLISGRIQAETARILGLSRSTVSYHKDKLIDGEFLEQNTRGMGFKRGPKAAGFEWFLGQVYCKMRGHEVQDIPDPHDILSNILPTGTFKKYAEIYESVRKSYRPPEFPSNTETRTHYMGFKCDIEYLPPNYKDHPDLEYSHTAKGTDFYKGTASEAIGTTYKFKLSSDKTLTFNIPGTVLKGDEALERFARDIFKRARDIAAFIGKEFGYKLANVRPYIAPHFEVHPSYEHERYYNRLFEESIGEDAAKAWNDASDGEPAFETNKVTIALAHISGPHRIIALEEENKVLRSDLEELKAQVGELMAAKGDHDHDDGGQRHPCRQPRRPA